MRERWIDSPAADAEAERLAEARDGYGPAEADHGGLDGPGGPGDPDPDAEYAGEGDAGRGAVQTTGEHLTPKPVQLWVVTLTYTQGRRQTRSSYATAAPDAETAIAMAIVYARPDGQRADANDRAAGRTYTVTAEIDPDGVVGLR